MTTEAATPIVAHVYVSNADSHDLCVFRLHEDGTLALADTLPVGGAAMPIALSPARDRLYVALRSEPYRVLSFAIERRTGALRQLGEAPLPDSMAYVSTDATGRFLFSASYGGGLVSVSPIDADGVAQAAQQCVSTGPKTHSIAAAPGNRHVFAAVLGDDAWLRFDFDAASGRLAEPPSRALTLAAQSGPRHFVFSRDGRVAYLLDELDGELHVLALRGADAAAGAVDGTHASAHGTARLVQTVSIVPDGFDPAAKPWGAELRLTPDGRFLYASERRSNTLSGYAVDTATGRLSHISTWPAEPHPRGFAIDPAGLFLIAAGQVSNHVRVYRIDAASGTLTPGGRYAAGRNPNWVEIIAAE